MKLLDLTLESPAEDLGLDEALLEEAGSTGEVLRLWEPRRTAVILGRSSKVDVEVNRQRCQELGIPVLRRSSGGATVVGGPGCLMYSVVLSYDRRPELRLVDRTHEFVLDAVLRAVRPLLPEATRQGISDLTWHGRKFSGNSLRCLRSHLLYHGTILFDFPLELIGTCLLTPPRQPDYRQRRSHGDFVTNLPVNASSVRQNLVAAWEITDTLDDVPWATTRRLVAEKYGCESWNQRL